MANVTITITDAQVTAWQEMLSSADLDTDLSTHLGNIADTHIVQAVDAQLVEKDLATKQGLL